MATLSVWKFDSAAGASDGLATLKRLQKQQLLLLQDAAMVAWPEQARKASITQLQTPSGSGGVGAFWGALFALLFLVPGLSLAIGAGAGALIASTGDLGIDDHLIKQLRDKLTRDTSALFMLTASAVTDRVLEEMQAQRGHVELIESNLTREQESKLRKMFAPEPAADVAVDEPSPRPAAA
jgi:uncharacterized membrane protein